MGPLLNLTTTAVAHLRLRLTRHFPHRISFGPSQAGLEPFHPGIIQVLESDWIGRTATDGPLSSPHPSRPHPGSAPSMPLSRANGLARPSPAQQWRASPAVSPGNPVQFGLSPFSVRVVELDKPRVDLAWQAAGCCKGQRNIHATVLLLEWWPPVAGQHHVATRARATDAFRLTGWIVSLKTDS